MRVTKTRQTVRADLAGSLLGSVDLRTDVHVINLSEDGAMIEHADHVAPGRTCILFLRLPGRDLRLGTQVIWSQVSKVSRGPNGEGGLRFRSGLHFPDLPEGAKAHLRDYLTSLGAPNSDPTEDPE